MHSFVISFRVGGFLSQGFSDSFVGGGGTFVVMSVGFYEVLLAVLLSEFCFLHVSDFCMYVCVGGFVYVFCVCIFRPFISARTHIMIFFYGFFLLPRFIWRFLFCFASFCVSVCLVFPATEGIFLVLQECFLVLLVYLVCWFAGFIGLLVYWFNGLPILLVLLFFWTYWRVCLSSA